MIELYPTKEEDFIRECVYEAIEEKVAILLFKDKLNTRYKELDDLLIGYYFSNDYFYLRLAYDFCLDKDLNIEYSILALTGDRVNFVCYEEKFYFELGRNSKKEVKREWYKNPHNSYILPNDVLIVENYKCKVMIETFGEFWKQ